MSVIISPIPMFFNREICIGRLSGQELYCRIIFGNSMTASPCGSVKNFVSLVKSGSFLVRIKI